MRSSPRITGWATFSGRLGPLVLPEDLAGLEVVADEASEVEDHDLAHPGQRRHQGRGVARPVVAPGPAGLAGGRVVGDQRVPVGSAGDHDHQAVDHQRRRRHAVIRGSAAVLREDVSLEEQRAGLEVERAQPPVHAEGVHAAAVEGGGRPGAVARQGALEAVAAGVAPAHRAGLEVVGHHQRLVPALLLGHREAVGHGEAGPAGAHGHAPDLGRGAACPTRGRGGSPRRRRCGSARGTGGRPGGPAASPRPGRPLRGGLVRERPRAGSTPIAPSPAASGDASAASIGAGGGIAGGGGSGVASPRQASWGTRLPVKPRISTKRPALQPSATTSARTDQACPPAGAREEQPPQQEQQRRDDRGDHGDGGLAHGPRRGVVGRPHPDQDPRRDGRGSALPATTEGSFCHPRLSILMPPPAFPAARAAPRGARRGSPRGAGPSSPSRWAWGRR